MRGISPTAQDKMLGKLPRMIPVAQLQEVIAEVRQDKVTALEQELATIKAENDRLRDLQAAAPGGFQPQKLAQKVGKLYGYKFSELKGASRSKPVVVARHHAIWLVKQRFPHLSLPAIARMFGGRDHTTILHALRSHPQRVELGLTQPDPAA
jgi:chromosomal replication initiation ATPase DnaA